MVVFIRAESMSVWGGPGVRAPLNPVGKTIRLQAPFGRNVLKKLSYGGRGLLYGRICRMKRLAGKIKKAAKAPTG